MARANNSGNGNNLDTKMVASSSGKVVAPYPIAKTMSPQKQQGGDLRMNGKKR